MTNDLSITKKKMGILKSVRGNLKMPQRIVAGIEEGEIEVVSIKPARDWKEYDVNKWDAWSTYQGLITYEIIGAEGGLSITVWDGDCLYGDPTQKRWTGEFLLPFDLIHELFVGDINESFRKYAVNVYEKEQRAEYEKRVNEIEQILLK